MNTVTDFGKKNRRANQTSKKDGLYKSARIYKRQPDY
jgi:hypothetical protein